MRYRIIFGIIALVVLGYVIGQFLPTEYLKPTVNTNTVNLSDYYGLLIQAIAAIATFLAVVAALFREEIRSWWKFVKLDYSIPEDKFREVISSNTSNSGDGLNTPIEAEKYLCEMEIVNSGTISSITSEIVLESLHYKSNYSNNKKPIEAMGIPLNWGKTDESRVTIPPNGKKKIPILELIPPDKESSPDGNEDTTIPKLMIKGIQTEITEIDGVWTATYLIYSSNSKPNRFKLEIKWNGKWHGRMTEMKECLTIELIK